MALSAGDFMFAGYDSHSTGNLYDESIAIVATTDIPAGEVIYITATHPALVGVGTFPQETIEYTVPDGGLAEGQDALSYGAPGPRMAA